jgi:hypothetical protein
VTVADLDLEALRRLDAMARPVSLPDREQAPAFGGAEYLTLRARLINQLPAILAELERAKRVEEVAREAAFCRNPEAVRDNRAPVGWGTVDCGKCTGCKLAVALEEPARG